MKLYSIIGGPGGTRAPENDELAKARLRKTLSNPESWFQSGRRLIFAMQQLEPSVAEFWDALATQGTAIEKPMPSVDCLQVHLMLAGLAIENLCKGHLVSQLSTEDKTKLEQGVLPERLDQKHRIRKLVSAINLPTSAIDDELLCRVEDSVRWLGRYPAPKSAASMTNEINAKTDVASVNDFLSRLTAHIGCQPK